MSQKRDLTEKHTLHEFYGGWSWPMLVLLIINVGLQVYAHVGLSAVIKSSIDPSESLFGGLGPIGAVNCTSHPEADVFITYWTSGGGQEAYAGIAGGCGFLLTRYGSDPESARDCVRGSGFLGPDECIDCYAVNVLCAFPCAPFPGNCLVAPQGTACVQCLEADDCYGKFERCADQVLLRPTVAPSAAPVPAPVARRSMQSVVPNSDLELVEVYEITFFGSVRDAWNGEAYGIAIVIVLFSGIWPYTKNVIIFVSYFVPMRAATRSTVLKNLTRFAKWALVDVFAVVLIVAGMRIDKEVSGAPLVVMAEPRLAIVAFAVAAIWDLAQGETVHYLHIKLLEKHGYGDNQPEPRAGRSVIEYLSSKSESKRACSQTGKWLGATFMFVQIVIAAAGLFVVCVSLDIGGFVANNGAGPNKLEYSTWTIGTALVDELWLQFNDAVPETVFLMLIFLTCAILIPLWEYSSILVLSYVRPSVMCGEKVLQSASLWVDILGGFACLDVFVLSFAVVMAEWSAFISAAVAGGSDEALCGGPCITVDANIQAGLWICFAGAALGWITELFFSFWFGKIYHPVENVRVAKVFFNALLGLSPFGEPAVRVAG